MWISRFDFMVSYCELPISNFAITLRLVRAEYGRQAVHDTIMAGRVKMGLGEIKNNRNAHGDEHCDWLSVSKGLELRCKVELDVLKVLLGH